MSTVDNTSVTGTRSGAIDTALGGEAMKGKKTLAAGFVYAVYLLVANFGLFERTDAIDELITYLVGTYGGLGIVAKVERYTNAFISLSDRKGNG